MGIGDWGLGIGDWAQSPIPNPQSPIPNPQSPMFLLKKQKNLFKYNSKYLILLIIIKLIGVHEMNKIFNWYSFSISYFF